MPLGNFYCREYIYTSVLSPYYHVVTSNFVYRSSIGHQNVLPLNSLLLSNYYVPFAPILYWKKINNSSCRNRVTNRREEVVCPDLV